MFANDHNMRNFYQATKELYEPEKKTACPVRSREDLLNQSKLADTRVVYSLPQYPVQEDLDNEPTWEEFERAFNSLPINKAPGEYGVPSEMLKNDST